MQPQRADGFVIHLDGKPMALVFSNATKAEENALVLRARGYKRIEIVSCSTGRVVDRLRLLASGGQSEARHADTRRGSGELRELSPDAEPAA